MLQGETDIKLKPGLPAWYGILAAVTLSLSTPVEERKLPKNSVPGSLVGGPPFAGGGGPRWGGPKLTPGGGGPGSLAPCGDVWDTNGGGGRAEWPAPAELRVSPLGFWPPEVMHSSGTHLNTQCKDSLLKKPKLPGFKIQLHAITIPQKYTEILAK